MASQQTFVLIFCCFAYVLNRVGAQNCTETDEYTVVCEKVDNLDEHLDILTNKHDKLEVRKCNELNIHPRQFARLNLVDFELYVNDNNNVTLEESCFAGILNFVRAFIKYNGNVNVLPNAFVGAESLGRLDIRYSNVLNIRQGSFYGLTHLRELQLDLNNIKHITPGTFDGMPELSFLLLFRNKLKKIEPGTFKNLTSVQHLWLSRNYFKDIPANFFSDLPNLLEIKMDFNRITHVHKNAFAGLEHLEKLYLNNNALTLFDVSWVNHMKHLNTISLECNNIDTIVGSFDLPQLTKVFLKDNKLDLDIYTLERLFKFKHPDLKVEFVNGTFVSPPPEATDKPLYTEYY